MALALPIDLLLYLSLAISGVALISALYAASAARRASREAKEYALKWELESIRPIEPPAAQREEENRPAQEPVVREATEEEMIERKGSEQPQQETSLPDTAEGLRASLGLEAFMLFDSLGRVIDYAGTEDAKRVAALMAELAGLAGVSSGDARFVFVGGERSEVIARIATMDSKVIYLYAKGVAESSGTVIDQLVKHAKSYFESITSTSG